MAKSSRTKASTATTVSRIKNYLPVRLRLSGDDGETTTFLYVKEHVENGGDGRSTTLFVANCPCVPPPYAAVSTKRLLQAIFGRYGDVTRVTVVNPRQSSVEETTTDEWLSSWTDSFHPPSFQTTSNDATNDNGKFAHVVFATAKDLKEAMRSLTDVMSDHAKLPAMEVSTLELQTLMDDEDDMDDAKDTATQQTSGVVAVAARYRASCQSFLSSRQALLDECNRVMQDYEDATDAAQRQRVQAASVPDDDGFITVSYASGNTLGADVGAGTNTAAGITAGRVGGRPTKRARRHAKKNLGGADPLPDFYRFQTRAHRQTTVHELRRRFEEDVKRVQQQQSR